MNTASTLKSIGLGKYIIYDNTAVESEKNKVILIMCYHLTKDLRDQCDNIKDPLDLWSLLNIRFSMTFWQKTMNKCKALKFQDFQSVENYHSALMNTVYSLELCNIVVRGAEKAAYERDHQRI